jgi:hypothetical protein
MHPFPQLPLTDTWLHDWNFPGDQVLAARTRIINKSMIINFMKSSAFSQSGRSTVLDSPLLPFPDKMVTTAQYSRIYLSQERYAETTGTSRHLQTFVVCRCLRDAIGMASLL